MAVYLATEIVCRHLYAASIYDISYRIYSIEVPKHLVRDKHHN